MYVSLPRQIFFVVLPRRYEFLRLLDGIMEFRVCLFNASSTISEEIDATVANGTCWHIYIVFFFFLVPYTYKHDLNMRNEHLRVRDFTWGMFEGKQMTQLSSSQFKSER
jgi:hypothetical protein